MEGGELHSHVNFHIIFGRQKSFFQDGLKKVTLGIAEYRVYLSTALEVTQNVSFCNAYFPINI